MYPQFNIPLCVDDIRHLSLDIKAWHENGTIDANSHLALFLNTLYFAMRRFAEAVD